MAVGSGANTRGFLKMNSGTINTTQQFNLGGSSGATTTRVSRPLMAGGTDLFHSHRHYHDELHVDG
jgi:hypothetical protein